MKNQIKRLLFEIVFPVYYWLFALLPIKNEKALFIEVGYLNPTDNFLLLEAGLREKHWMTEFCFLGKYVVDYKEYVKRCFAMLRRLARVQYVFLNEGCNIIGCIKLKKDTKIIQTWHGCGAFKKFGYSLPNPPQKNYYGNYDMVTVSSPAVVDIYSEALNLDKKKIVATGVSRTDVFFNSVYQNSASDKLKKYIQIANKRKIVLFAPTFRDNAGEPQGSQLPDIDILYRRLKDDYIFLYNAHPVVNTENQILDNSYNDFFINISRQFSIQDLLMVSDICITDYSSLIFEYSLLERPLIFYAYDYQKYFKERGFYYDYASFIPGPICLDTEELCDCLENISCYDYSKLNQFREKFMASCDGHATERIIKMVVDLTRDK